MEEDELSRLEELLCTVEDSEKVISKNVKNIDIFTNNVIDDSSVDSANKTSKISAIHSGETDSSDDEEQRNYTERKYNDYGTKVKKILSDIGEEQYHKRLDFETRLRQTNTDIKTACTTSFIKKQECELPNKTYSPGIKNSDNIDVYADPIFGIRIIKPLISSAALSDRMQGREAINMMRVKRYVENEDLSKDWVIAGAIVRKSTSKQSQKGSQFLIWTLSDLKDDLKTVSMFLFGKAYRDLWKTSDGTVVAVLNPNILGKSQNSSDQACLSVDSSDRVMILGQSKDLGVCKSRKKNGEPCTAFVNKSQCEHCIYHVKQEYQKYSKRQELQSSTMGKGLINLQNKVLGKSTVIYGGKSYSALPIANTRKVKQQDQNRLMSLSDYYNSESEQLMINKAPYGAGSLISKSAFLHSPTSQKTSDSDRLNKLCSSKFSNSPTLSDKVAHSSRLGTGFSLKGSGTIDLNKSYGQKRNERSKLDAIKIIQANGGIPKHDPNNIKGTQLGKKRALEKLNTSIDENDPKKLKLNEEKTLKTLKSERFKKILEATSAHQVLIEQHQDNEQEKYFNKLEKKEAMEEKMLNTFKLACKAVRCTKCKYTAFSAAQLCKDEKHPLKVLDSFKRFFKCADCGNRTISLEIIPLHSCNNCSGSRWEKAPMLREKKVTSISGTLSIRGEEETFIGGTITSGRNINLLVPENN